MAIIEGRNMSDANVDVSGKKGAVRKPAPKTKATRGSGVARPSNANEDMPEKPTKDPQETRAPAVNRAVAILALLARSDVALGINAIAREVGIVPSTCHHIIRALEQEELITVNPVDRRCSIGLGLVRLAKRALLQNLPEPNAQFEIDMIAQTFGITASISKIDFSQRAMVIAVADPEARLSIRVNIGYRIPVWASATGRVHAAVQNLSPIMLRKMYNSVKWAVPPSFDDWMADVEYAKAHAVGVDRGNFVAGVEIHAAAIMEYGKMQGTVAALVNVGGLNRLKEAELHAVLRAAAARLSI